MFRVGILGFGYDFRFFFVCFRFFLGVRMFFVCIVFFWSWVYGFWSRRTSGCRRWWGCCVFRWVRSGSVRRGRSASTRRCFKSIRSWSGSFARWRVVVCACRSWRSSCWSCSRWSRLRFICWVGRIIWSRFCWRFLFRFLRSTIYS